MDESRRLLVPTATSGLNLLDESMTIVGMRIKFVDICYAKVIL
ncbi:hypothetical protein [Campylobacter massiliensis]|nr:hypothetical protein [Campylobacter massiliensis]